ncbi:protein kinase domain-containing protein [uncultured Microbacterium sp.]|uniref:protein kinase domain-containing protein n=1 Tax=uncultured Microbacterium sp. TaxID=191216 RepID=UPI0025FAC4CF|nr:PASTA domain-containing protein [uncultured Microbacterium sp.]
MSAAAGLVAGRFRVEGLLGSGGTASVFRAHDEVTGRTVAVKLLHPHLSRSDALREAFLVEGRRTAHVSHPGIVGVVDLGTFDDDGLPVAWIAQQLVDGVTLSEHVRERGPLTAQDAVAVGIDVLEALAAAHAGGLVHRDVSPANVLIRFEDDQRPRATLLDFGLADAAGRTAHGDDVLRSSVSPGSAGVVGNVEFASPEQVSGRPVGPAGDLYQVGGLLYFALTGRAPFAGPDRAAVIRAHLHAAPPVPSVIARTVPPALDRVVVRALVKEPADRFADAAAMRDAARAAVAAPQGIAPAPRTSATRVLAVGRPDTSAPPAAASRPTRETASTERGSRGWGTVIVVIALLAAAATAVPLMAGAGRERPAVADPAAASTPSASPTPETRTATPAPEPVATAVVPALGPLDTVRAALADAGLRLGEITQRDAALPAGTVLSADPAPGASVPRGSAVRLVVASGITLVPDVSGMDAATAASTLRTAGLIPAQTTAASGRPAGTVVSVEPAPGGTAPVGSTVTVTIAVPVPTPTPTAATPIATPTPAVTTTPTAAPR